VPILDRLPLPRFPFPRKRGGPFELLPRPPSLLPRVRPDPRLPSARPGLRALEALEAQGSGSHQNLFMVLKELLGFSPEFLAQPWSDFMPTWGEYATAQDRRLTIKHALHELVIHEGCFLGDSEMVELHCQSIVQDSSVTLPLLLHVVSYKLFFLIAPDSFALGFLAFIEEYPRIF